MVFRVFKDAVTEVMVGYKPLRVQRKGNISLTDEIKESIEGKRRAYKKFLQRNVADEIIVRRTEYRSWN